MSVTQIIDAAIKLYRTHWKVLMGLMAWILLPFALLQALAVRLAGPIGTSLTPPVGPGASLGQAISRVFPARFVAVTLAFTLVHYLLLTPFLTAAVARAAGEFYLGRDVTVAQVYRAALRRFWPILGILILTSLSVTFGLFLLIIGAVFFFVRLAVGTIAVMVEGIGPVDGIRRSYHLTKGFWWRIFGLMLLTYLMVQIVSGILAIIPAVLAQFAGPVDWVVSGLGGAAALIIVTPFTTIVYTLLYFDLRIRKEGFDLAVLADQLRPQ